MQLLSWLWRIFINQPCARCQKIHSNKEFKHICSKCSSKIILIAEDENRCSVCYDSWVIKGVCQNCLSLKNNWKKLSIVFSYQDPIIKKIFFQYKFKNSLLAEKDLTRLLMPYRDSLKNYYIIVAPCSYKTYRLLGFNPVARILDNLDIPYEDCLSKNKNAILQKHLSGNERKQQDNPFFLKKPIQQECFDQNILVVDDIFTTGSTIVHIIEKLEEQGFKNIDAFCFARD
ncbi:MAG: ComF family protein [Brevinema sp.]